MTKSIEEIRNAMVEILESQNAEFNKTSDTYEKYELHGTLPAMQGKKKVDGFYFASVIPKPKDVRLYLFAAYTHTEALGELPADVKKCLKGKSCFHIKYMDDELKKNFTDVITKSVELYKKDGLLK